MPLTGKTLVLPEKYFQRYCRCMSCGKEITVDSREQNNVYTRRFCSESCRENYLK